MPATFLLAPLMFYGLLGMTIALAGIWRRPFGMAAAWPILLLIAELLVGCASLACLWFLLLRGVDPVRRVPRWRRLAASLLLVGLADAVYFLLADPKVTRELVSSTTSIVMWAALLVLPMLVGGRYLVLLLAPIPPAQP